MAIAVQIKCSDCGTVSDKLIKPTDTEIVCPECRRNMPNLAKDEFKSVASSLGTQRLMGIFSLLFAIGMGVCLYFYIGSPKLWPSTDDPKYFENLAKAGIKPEDTTQFLYAAGGCLLLSAVLGVLASRKRYVVEF